MSIASRGTRQTNAIVNVQALRALAALLVVVHHMALPQFGVDNIYGSNVRFLSAFVSFGQFGVDLFFVISGFIMVVTTWHLMGSRAGGGFFLRRVIRIYPSYWLALLPVLLAHWYLHGHGLHVLGGAQNGKTNGLATLLLLPHRADEFLSLPPAWTLVFEMSFYLIFAVLLVLARRLLVPALCAWLLAEVGLFYAYSGSGNFLLDFLGTPLPIEFIAGAFIGILYRHGTLPWSRLAAALAVCSIGVFWIAEMRTGDVLYAHFGSSPHQNATLSTYHNTIGRVILAGIPAVLAVYAAVALETRRLLVAPAWLVGIGDSSYALYLWNLTVIVGVRQVVVHLQLHGHVAHVATLVSTFALVAAISLLIYRFFERPVTDRLNRLQVRSIPARSSDPGHAAHVGAAVDAI